MKNLYSTFLLVLISLFIAFDGLAQVPQGFNFQAVARDAGGLLLSNQNLSVEVSVLKGSESGESVYTETHSLVTDESGVFKIIIGEGDTADEFTAINWPDDNYFIGLAIDTEGGSNFESLGATRLLSVPYAQVAQNVVNGLSAGDESITQYTLNSSQGDTSFTIHAHGSNELGGALKIKSETDGHNRGVDSRVITSSGNNSSQVGVYGRAEGSGSNSHFGVYGIALGDEGIQGSRYGLFGWGEGHGRYNFGVQGIARGPGDGTFVPLGEGPPFGSYNIAGGFYSSGNLNGNTGVEGVAEGNEGSRANFGVIGTARATSNAPNIGIRAEAFNSPLSNVGLEADVFGETENIGLRVYARNGTSNIGLKVNADTAAILNGHSVINGNLTVNGTIYSDDAGSATSEGYFELLQIQNNGSMGVEAKLANDPNGGDPDGWSGHVSLWGKNSPNIQLRGADWENSDLPVVQLFGNKPNGEGWFHEHASMSVRSDNSQQWGHISLSANEGISNIEISAKHWEDAVEGAGRPFMKFSGNIPGQDLIWMEVESTEGGTAERGNLRFHNTNGQEFGINANGIYGNQPLHWNGGNLNVNDGSLYVNGDISYTGNLDQTSDRNLKENIRPLQDALETIMQLTPKTYNYRGNGDYNGLKLSRGLHYGLIAQEVETVLPSLVRNNTHVYTETSAVESGPDYYGQETEKYMEYKTMNYTELIPVLIKAVQEQQEEIQLLKDELEKLKN